MSTRVRQLSVKKTPTTNCEFNQTQTLTFGKCLRSLSSLKRKEDSESGKRTRKDNLKEAEGRHRGVVYRKFTGYSPKKVMTSEQTIHHSSKEALIYCLYSCGKHLYVV
jgi:hypothetical protein